MEKHLETGRIAEKHNAMKYTIVFEKAPNNYAAFSPDLPGCVSTADTPEEMRLMIREAIEFHFECLELDGDPIPVPSAGIETTTIAGWEYIVVYEKDPDNYVAYVPDFLPQCEVTGCSISEVRQKVQWAIADYLVAKKLSGDPLPEPSARAETMEIAHPSEVLA